MATGWSIKWKVPLAEFFCLINDVAMHTHHLLWKIYSQYEPQPDAWPNTSRVQRGLAQFK